MDPLTQGVIGSVASQQFANPKNWLLATLLGFFSGMAADIDVLIRSDVDPLLALEYHRQFTHSLIFIPIGGFLCSVLVVGLTSVFFRREVMPFRQVYLFCTLGYGTHGLLDACTTYGTQLLWPFSNQRFAWNTISIIDPLFTIPLLVLIIVAVCLSSRKVAVAALSWVIIYSAFGVVQRERAEALGMKIAQQRGHTPISLEAKPSFANLLVWKVVYITETDFYVDAVRAVFSSSHYQGASIPKLDVSRDFPWLDTNSQQAKDIERFRWFSNGYIALSPRDPNVIIDIRYSLIPNEIIGLWGIELNSRATLTQHVRYITQRNAGRDSVVKLWSMILGEPL